MIQKTRNIVHIDPDKCDGCGVCVPSCAEGAIQIIDGKARLVADRLCDGLGACLGQCPRGAITIEERPADEFDQAAVDRHAAARTPPPMTFAAAPRAMAPVPAAGAAMAHGGCPGSRMRLLNRPLATAPAAAPAASGEAAVAGPSQLRQWPVQLALLPAAAAIWQDADILLAADCVPFACPAFHQQMLAGKALAIACPKLDDCGSYVQKLASILANHSVRSITVARMEVPCCGGLVRVAEMALAKAGRTDIPLRTIIVHIDGTVDVPQPV